MDNGNPVFFFFGAGYVARHFGGVLVRCGIPVTGTSRSAEKRAQLKAAGWDARDFNAGRLDPLAFDRLKGASHLVVSIPPEGRADPAARFVLDRPGLCTGLKQITYLSATSVYGNRAGDWVGEDSEPRPTSASGQARLSAERAWQGAADRLGIPLVIFRLAGIYGPGRGPLQSVRAGRARRIIKPGHVFSRIHVADIAGALDRAHQGRPAPGIYNLADNHPAPQAEVTAYAAKLLGVPMPPAVSWAELEPASPLARFFRDNKRVSNEKLVDTFGVKLTYPDYRSGLRALVKAGQ